MARFFSTYDLEKFYAWTAALSVAVIAVCFWGLSSTIEQEERSTLSPKDQGIQVQFVESVPLSATPNPIVKVLPASEKPFEQTLLPVVPLPEPDTVKVPSPKTEDSPLSSSPITRAQESAEGGTPTLVPAKFTPLEGGRFPDPLYPRWARQQNIQGTLLLLVTVQVEGGVAKIEVTESSGNTKLDAFASDWVRQHWIWPPGSPRSFLVPFVFQLK